MSVSTIKAKSVNEQTYNMFSAIMYDHAARQD